MSIVIVVKVSRTLATRVLWWITQIEVMQWKESTGCRECRYEISDSPACYAFGQACFALLLFAEEPKLISLFPCAVAFASGDVAAGCF